MPLLKCLLDTNTISDRLRGEQAVVEWIQEHGDQAAISTLTLAEMRRGIELRPEGKARRELEKQFRFTLEDFAGAIWVFDEAAAAEWGRLMAEARSRNRPLPFADSLIAAVARSMGAQVVTRNHEDFPGCDRLDPWTGLGHSAW
jgi:predicted nucleic acid-binding protein